MSIADYPGAGSLGTQVLLPAIRKALEAERPVVHALVRLGELAVRVTFGLTAGVFLVAGPTWGVSLVAVWFVAWVMLVCTLVTLVWMAEAATRWWWHTHRRRGVRRGGLPRPPGWPHWRSGAPAPVASTWLPTRSSCAWG